VEGFVWAGSQMSSGGSDLEVAVAMKQVIARLRKAAMIWGA